MSARKFSELRDDLYQRSPGSRARVAEEAARLSDEMGLADLRARTRRTQTEIAHLIGTSQSGVSRLERQEDLLVSTLRDYVEATGGHLRLIAEYEDHESQIDLPVLSRGSPTPKPRGFHVVWQDIRTRQFVHVGRLAFTGEGFTFSYTSDAESHPAFEPFPPFPDFRGSYESRDLFPFFADRVLSAAHALHERQLGAMGLTPQEATPLELLSQSWGQSPHETVQIVPEPQQGPDGSVAQLFLASGVRHAAEGDKGDGQEHVTQRVASLRQGQQLSWREEPDNPFNDRAIRLESDGHRVGWLPDYLLDYVHKQRGEGRELRVTVERANGPDVPWHLRLLCRLEFTPPGLLAPPSTA